MHLISYAIWPLLGLLAYLGAAVNAASVLEIDVVFPRTNETYAPIDYFPIVFALQNAELAKHLKPSIYSFVRNGTDLLDTFGHSITDLTSTNFSSSEPYFVYHYLKSITEGPHRLFATAIWRSCDESGDQVAIVGHDINLSIYFNVERGGQEVDLVAATEKCSPQDGVAINVTDQTHDVPEKLSWEQQQLSGTCAVLASSSPTPTADPCRVKIDTTVAASMSAFLKNALCKGLNPPSDCPEESAVQKLVVTGVAGFAAASGAIVFLPA